MRYGIIGSQGRMGLELIQVFDGHELVFKRDVDLEEETGTPEVIIDFSTRKAFLETIASCEKFGSALVIGTTALESEDFQILKDLSKKVPVVQSYNFSIGINLLKMILREYSPYFNDWDLDIVESHHNKKKDAPSGTAIMLKEATGRDADCHSLRMGGIPGDHSVIYANEGEIVEFKHRALSRKVFAIGALKASEFAVQSDPGFYTFEEVLSWMLRK